MYEYSKLSSEERKQLVEERLALGHPPHSPPHPIRDQLYYLFTAACYEHKHHMSVGVRRKQILDLLFEQFTKMGMEIQGWVVLSNHYHLLVRVIDFEETGAIFGRVHGSTSYLWNREESTVGRKVWYRFADRAIRSERHYYTTLNYIHNNPVKHNAVASPYDWAESSVHWYLEQHGREWLRSLWTTYPLRDYGKGWDDL